MAEYRRLRVPGGCYFFTVNLLHRRSTTLLLEIIDLLRHAVRRICRERPFTIDAWVVLPHHLHVIWTLPKHDADFSTRWRLIKHPFVRGLPATESRSPGRRARDERGIWQRRFWEHTIRDAADYAAHIHYVHFNPVRHGYVDSPAAWPYSTFHRCVERGLYPKAWTVRDSLDLSAGEAT